jgi:hypothetical protein
METPPMATKKTPSTVKTLQTAPKVAAKTAATKLSGNSKKTVSKSMMGMKKASAKRMVANPKKTSLDVLRLFMKTYENL